MNFSESIKIFNEEKDSGRAYLQTRLIPQTKNIFEKYFKLSVLSKSDKNDYYHWLGEMKGAICTILTTLDGGVSAEDIYNTFYNNLNSDTILNKKRLFPKYNSLFNIKNYEATCKSNSVNYLNYCKQLSNFIINNYRIKGLFKQALVVEQENRAENFINNYFGELK